ncbi:probable G-protein coupled receptor 158 [Coccinella septempunctata]|uniref:probable G-protein coupled receptor 158 n=1 Tax=Coccinella septempunctata TaxID=41139 RepID=UPI001D063E7C|nr:probable G-protein coupled receptor 158 [Coccinella septempunctata]
MIFEILCLLSIPPIISPQDIDFQPTLNIRHRKSRNRYLRNQPHTDFYLNNSSLTSFLSNNSELHPIRDNDIFIQETQPKIEPQMLTDVKNYTIGTAKNKTRKITVNVNSNNSWNNMDKSMLFIGERALKKKVEDIKNASTSDEDEEDVNGDEDGLFQTEKPFEILRPGNVDIVTRFLRIVESQHLLGENCTAGTDLNLGEGVVDRYAQERFRVEADVAVNRANMLTRLWKYAGREVLKSEYLLHASVFSMVEFDDDIFAAGNCYDQHQYQDYLLFCPYAYRLPEGTILVKDLAVEYNYLSNTSEWFYIARKNAEKVIKNYNQFSRGYNTYTSNGSTHSEKVPDEILSVRYEDGKWSKPYYDCGGGNIWMLTYTVPFFGYANNTYFFKGTSGIDVDLRRVDIDQCPLPKGSTQLNIFAASDKCKKRTTECVPIPGLGFRRGSYKCVCKHGFYFPDTTAEKRYYNGTVIEEEYEKLMIGEKNRYGKSGIFECLRCPEGCEACEDDRPCVVSLNWLLRSVILGLSCVIICCLPVVVIFTWKYGNVKVVRAASPVLLRVITLGAFFIYCTIIVMYPRPSVYTCTARVWLREIGFSLTYGALMLKTWRISVIFRVRSAKAVKITDMNLLKRLGVIVAVFTVFLVIRTLVAPPIVIVGRTADDLKAYLCRTDWWDHSFSTMEVIFLVWGIRLCIVVRKAPSEFNESKFISMAIYNEFLLSVFLNISMLFLQKPANPDLLYIIFFCHTQLTVTLLLCLIFGSKAYMVFKHQEPNDDGSGMMSKSTTSKFLTKPRSANSQYTSTNSSMGVAEYIGCSEQDVQEEFLRFYTQLELLREKNMRIGNRHLASKITAMQDAAKTYDNAPTTDATTCRIAQLNNALALAPIDENSAKSKRISVSFASEPEANGGASVATKEGCDVVTEGSSSKNIEHTPIIELTQKEDKSSSPNSDRNGRCLKSGHAKTHAIVINLDDKSRFTEEVTV